MGEKWVINGDILQGEVMRAVRNGVTGEGRWVRGGRGGREGEGRVRVRVRGE